SGGNETVKYMGAIGYLGQEGIMQNSSRKQFNARTNLDIQLTKRLLAKINLAYINNTTKDANSSYANGSSDQIIRQVQRISPWIVNQYEDGSYGAISDGNPIAWLDSGQTVDRVTDNFTGSATAEYTIIDGLKVSAQGSYVMNHQDYNEFVKHIKYNANAESPDPDKLSQDFYNWNRASADVLINYNKTFKEKHKLGVMLGYHTELYKYKEAKTFRKGFPNQSLTDMNAGASSTQTNSGYTRELAMESFFGRINYDYAGKYLLEANVRADASSRFARDNRWGVFPSFSAGWRISEEKFMSGAKNWLNNMKLRGSWGKLGNQDALSDYYPYMPTYDLSPNYPFEGSLNQGAAQTAAKLETISWEEATNWGIGLDATFLNCLNITAEYYNRETTGILMEVAVPTTFGMKGYWDNVGKMTNRGVEFSANFNKTFGDWTVGVGGNFAYNKNEVLDLGGVQNLPPSTQIKKLGSPINAFYLYESDGLFQNQAEIDSYLQKYKFKASGKKIYPGDLIYKDQNGDNKIDSNDRIVIGQPDPKWTFGLNLSAEWKGIDFSALFQGAAGVNRYFNNEVYGNFNGDTGHPSTFWRNAWTPENTNTGVPRYALEGTSVSMQDQVNSTYWLSNASYVRLKNVQLGYTLPARWTKSINISRIRVYYSGQNLFTIHNMGINVDPESPSGRASHYPQVMVNSIGVNITF
ncbi:MAG: SusC/RagA family TonB-linked outer membrane protein, partial [Rikenellaceae bacterium]